VDALQEDGCRHDTGEQEDAEGVGRRDRWWERPLVGAREVPVPSSYNDLFPDAAVRGHIGDVWYQTTVRVPREHWTPPRYVAAEGARAALRARMLRFLDLQAGTIWEDLAKELPLVSGTVVGALIMARKGVAEGRKTAVPFGPFLAFGGVVAYFVGDAMVDWYLSTF